MQNVGISMPEEVLERIDGPLEYGDSRSKRAVRLLEYGLAVDEFYRQRGVNLDDESVRAATANVRSTLRQGWDS